MRSAGTLPSRVHLLPVLVLAALLADSLGEDFIFRPDWGFDSYEITIPRKLSFRGGEQGAARYLSYLLQVEGKKRVLHLWPKRFLLPRNLPVFSYTEHGALMEDYPYIPRDCNYMGLVEDAEDSEATFSTCAGGLRGILKIDARHYQIEPLKESSRFEHVIFLLKDEGEWHDQICGFVDGEREEQMAQYENMARDFSGPTVHQKYLELGLLFDHQRFLYSNSNVTEVTDDAILVTSIMDTYFQELSIRILLCALEIWTDQDKVNIDFPTLQQALGQFLIYQRNVLSAKLAVDWAQLYIKRHYVDALAWSWGRVCTKRYAGSVSVFPDRGVLGPGTWGAHNLGHSVGMSHDDKYCRCKGKRSCIMGTGRAGFSNCSMIHFFNHVHREADCLNNIPGQVYVIKRCGNKIVEDNEECDCGTLDDCESDRCCQPGCKFRHGANCSIGLCCHNCHFRPSGYLCRKEENECDLAEYCDGVSSFCPNDTYKQDGTPCKYQARCFRNGCQSAYMQCQRIFGPDAREAPYQCYEALNVVGDQYGNCGIIGTGRYKKCSKSNALCGRLQCINVKTLPKMPDHTKITSTHLGNENLMCWGTGYHLALVPMGIPDVGVIRDGTSCGKDRICVDTMCMNASILKFDCLPEKCNHRGFCNNNKNCHCLYGWAPPFCEEVGYGGSVDSGPPGRMEVRMATSAEVVLLTALRLILLVISVAIVLFRRFIKDFLKAKQTETPPMNPEVTKPEGMETPPVNPEVSKPKATEVKKQKVIRKPTVTQ